MSTVCGTGSGNFPQPGDPSTSVTLSAQSVLGGILLSWTYPSLNPEAVAHFTLYRSTSSDPATRKFLAKAQGTSFMDYVSPQQTGVVYYYWIEVVSVHGTVGELNGPASAQFIPHRDTLAELAAGRFDENQLSFDLNERLNRINEFEGLLADETGARNTDMTSVFDALGIVETDLDRIDTVVANETFERTTADSALVDEINLLYGRVDENQAGILDERTIRASETDALSQDVTTLFTDVGANSATLQTHAETIDGISASFMVKTDVNGHVAGFGLFNEEGTSQFILAVDSFVVSNATTTATPFSIDGTNIRFNGVVSFDNVSGDKPPPDATRNVYRGNWAVDTVYPEGDIVLDGGNGYISLADHTSTSTNRPPSTSWGDYTVKGDQGDQGDRGYRGYKGDEGDPGPKGDRGYRGYKGDKGDKGDPGAKGDDGESGAASAKIFRRGTSVSKPADGSALPPTGWSMTVPTGTDPVWECNGNQPAGSTIWYWDEPLVSSEHWVKPGTTLIDGNTIFTGDAYVDTLQIKGNAVTIPSGSAGNSGAMVPQTYWGDFAGGSVTIDWGNKPPDAVQVVAFANFMPENTGTQQQTLLLRVHASSGGVGGEVGATNMRGYSNSLSTVWLYSNQSGSVTYKIEVRTPDEPNQYRIGSFGIIVLGVRR